MKIALFMGGSSEEREVSIMSGRACYEGLKQKKHDVTLYDVEWKGSNSLFKVIEEITDNGTDVVFSTLHGGLGENGGVQGLLEAAGIEYTGSGITASAIAMNKDITKSLFSHHNIPTAKWLTGTAGSIDISRVKSEIGFPCVTKPVDQGSSFGINVVNSPGEIEEALEKSAVFGEKIMVEKYISGKELSVPILGKEVLPTIEIRPSHAIYDYECKYTPGMSEYFVPAPIPEKLTEEISSIALKAFDVLGLRDIARIDFRIDKNGRPLCFEANTLPGMTATSLVPKSAAKVGIDFPELVTKIVQFAYQRKRKK